VELVEIHSRRVFTERSVEVGLEQTTRSERTMTEEDEISDAIKKDNQNNTKLGVSASVEGGVNFEVFSVHAQASGSYGYDTTEKTAREQLHKRARTQSTKTSDEIKRNFKSTFRTITEVEDTTSKRYVLQNSTSELVNYELRRKMRRVGVQLQDMGTHLCWQTLADLRRRSRERPRRRRARAHRRARGPSGHAHARSPSHAGGARRRGADPVSL
jgi:hypothetical protein